MDDDEKIWGDADAAADDYEYRRRFRRGCECHGDMPGYCPGPNNCPMAEHDAEDEE